eukprot:scaffold10417_cov137-Skeletonema_marinoi.AAC.13
MSWLLAFGDGRPTDNFYSNREGPLRWVSEKTGWVSEITASTSVVPPKHLLTSRFQDERSSRSDLTTCRLRC